MSKATRGQTRTPWSCITTGAHTTYKWPHRLQFTGKINRLESVDRPEAVLKSVAVPASSKIINSNIMKCSPGALSFEAPIWSPFPPTRTRGGRITWLTSRAPLLVSHSRLEVSSRTIRGRGTSLHRLSHTSRLYWRIRLSTRTFSAARKTSK